MIELVDIQNNIIAALEKESKRHLKTLVPPRWPLANHFLVVHMRWAKCRIWGPPDRNSAFMDSVIIDALVSQCVR